MIEAPYSYQNRSLAELQSNLDNNRAQGFAFAPTMYFREHCLVQVIRPGFEILFAFMSRPGGLLTWNLCIFTSSSSLFALSRASILGHIKTGLALTALRFRLMLMLMLMLMLNICPWHLCGCGIWISRKEHVEDIKIVLQRNE